jgi:hypothetical protein
MMEVYDSVALAARSDWMAPLFAAVVAVNSNDLLTMWCFHIEFVVAVVLVYFYFRMQSKIFAQF